MSERGPERTGNRDVQRSPGLDENSPEAIRDRGFAVLKEKIGDYINNQNNVGELTQIRTLLDLGAGSYNLILAAKNDSHQLSMDGKLRNQAIFSQPTNGSSVYEDVSIKPLSDLSLEITTMERDLSTNEITTTVTLIKSTPKERLNAYNKCFLNPRTKEIFEKNHMKVELGQGVTPLLAVEDGYKCNTSTGVNALGEGAVLPPWTGEVQIDDFVDKVAQIRPLDEITEFEVKEVSAGIVSIVALNSGVEQKHVYLETKKTA